ncbi:MAG: hypothetical protein VZQ75_02640 [Candidatus Faecousia sp.]|nr:hypothetical protein [Candidatus Faecousia sp.]
MAFIDRFRRRQPEDVLPPDAEQEPETGPVGVGAFAPREDAQIYSEALPMSEVIGKDQIAEAVQTLRKYMAGKARLDARIVENDKWWRQQHWDVMREQGTTQLKTKSAWLVNVVLSKHADAMDALPEPNCLPRAEDDQEEARRLSKILPVVLEQADFQDAWEESWWRKLKAGLGIYGVFWDKSMHNGLGDVAIRAVDPLKLYWEPGVTRLQASRNLFLLELVDNETLEEQYPELHGKLGGKAVQPREYYRDEAVDTTNKSPVIDWYYKKREGGKTVLHYVKFVGETILYATENDPQRTETGLYDHGQYPFFADVLFPEEGTPAGFGYIDLCKDAQRQIDLMNNAIVANCVAAATPRWLKRGDDGISEAEYADWTRPFVHVQGSLDDNAMRQITVSPLSGNYLAVLESKIAEMKETSGNRDVNNGGVPSGVTAASAIAAMQEQSGKLSRDQIRTSYKTFKGVVQCVIELIRQFYAAPRQFRITGEGGQEQFVFYGNSGLKPQPFVDPVTKTQTALKPLFDLKISAQKATEYTKMAQNEFALQLYQLGMFAPNNADPALATLEMMDFDGKDTVIQRIQQNMMMFQMLQQAQAENAMLKSMLGMGGGAESGAPGAPAPTGAPGGSSAAPARLPQADGAQGGISQRNQITDKARARAQAATQPG